METTLTPTVPAHVPANLVYDFDIYNDEQIRKDLHASYARLHREAPPVFYTPANGGHWLITRHELMSEVVRDFETFSARESQIPRVENAPLLIPLNLDPPEHTWYRQAVAPFFGPRSVAAREEELREFAREVVASVANKGSCDFVRDVAAPFPVTVFMRMMGFPTERFHDFRTLADRFFNARDPQEIGVVSQAIIGELAALIGAKQAAAAAGAEKNDLLSQLVDAKINGEPIQMDKLVALCFLLFLGGLDTVTNALSFAIRYLAGDKALQARLRDDPEALMPFVEEAIRLYGVVNTPRIVTKDCERLGVKFRKNDMVLCLLPMAGWDDLKNESPEKFDIDRKTRSYLTFSTGPHLCLGHFLARLELRILYAEWIKQIGEFSLADGYQPSYRAGMVMSLDSLPLKWAAR
jgi:cytochrome P450